MPARRITILTTGLALGGAEAQVALLSISLKRRGWDVQVVSMLAPQAFEEELQAAGVPLICLDMRPGVPDPRALIRLARHLWKHRPHILHCHMVHANLLGRLARLAAPVSIVVSTAHSVWEGGGWRNWAYRLTEPLSDLTSNVSQCGLERYIKEKLTRPGKAIWMPNGLDVSKFSFEPGLRESTRERMAWTAEDFVWLAVGNLREPKDYPNLLRAFTGLLLHEPRATLAIAGCGCLEHPLIEQAKQLGIRERVQFLGQRRDIRQLLQGADAYVISSSWEGTPMALLEAAASQLAVVATRVGGNPEVVEDEKSGLLVPPGDSARLCAAMCRMMSFSTSERALMGVHGRRRLENVYGHEGVLNKWENIYHQLLLTRRRGGLGSPWKSWLWKKS
ncbi:MAG TPA: glycosyltransferase [Bryobacteraceae bacterium]|nr:glycosyltransferase [Bryobacteraceae bacterium]